MLLFFCLHLLLFSFHNGVSVQGLKDYQADLISKYLKGRIYVLLLK